MKADETVVLFGPVRDPGGVVAISPGSRFATRGEIGRVPRDPGGVVARALRPLRGRWVLATCPAVSLRSTAG